MRLKDKTAIVTGGSSGIGQAACILLARDGADVAVIYNGNSKGAQDTVDKVEAEGRRGLAIKADVSKRSEVQTMVDRVVDAFGHIDILINNAGILESIKILDLTEEQWRKSLGVMLDGVFFVAQAVKRVVQMKG